MDNKILALLPDALLPWYRANKRDLPWRKDRNPYHVWLSEIMLQQTRVEAVKGYYSRFLAAGPSIAELAKADDSLLEKLWEGLGYYSRVRNLKKAAIQIMQQHNGVFPDAYNKIIELSGIGAYTAGAICSIAFNQPTPAVDGNVLRVTSRLTNDATPIDSPAFRKQVSEALMSIYPADAGDFTQALMELGATVCKPNGKPDCKCCPCGSFCKALEQDAVMGLPVRSPKKARRREELTVLILNCDGHIALERRPKDGLLANLWQFPNLSGRRTLDEIISNVEKNGIKVSEIKAQVERKHIFTHVEWDMSGIYMDVANVNDRYSWLKPEEIKRDAALPTAFRMFLDEFENLR